MQKNRRKISENLENKQTTLATENNFQQYQNWVNLVSSESLGQELRFAKRIN